VSGFSRTAQLDTRGVRLQPDRATRHTWRPASAGPHDVGRETSFGRRANARGKTRPPACAGAFDASPPEASRPTRCGRRFDLITRRTNAFPKKLENDAAKEAGIADHVWSIEEIVWLP